MRIILATPIYPPEIGGPATYTSELGERLGESHDITIVAYADEPEHVRATRLVVVSKKIFLPLRLWMYFYILFREAKNTDVIYVQNAVAAGLPAALVGLLRKKPVVLKFVGDEAWERATAAKKTNKTLDAFLASAKMDFKTKIFYEIQKFTFHRVSKIVPPSDFLGNILAAHYGVPRKKIEVNYNAFEGSVPLDVHKKPHQIVSVGRLTAWKGVDGVIDAMPHILQSVPNASLVIVGDGPERTALKKLTKEKGLESNVIFKGRLPKAETNRLEAESEVMVLNSTYEGLPHTALESFAMGTPLIATNIGGTNEAVRHEKTGLLVEPGNPQELAAAIIRLFNNPHLEESLVEGGKEILKKKFSWEQHIQNLLAVFSSLKEN